MTHDVSTDEGPLTGEVVDKIFQACIQQPPRPNLAECQQLAELINTWRPGGRRRLQYQQDRWPQVDEAVNPTLWPTPTTDVWPSTEDDRERWRRAAGSLRQLLQDRRAEAGTTYPVGMMLAIGNLEEALTSAQKYFGWRESKPEGKDWNAPALDIMAWAISFVAWARRKPSHDGPDVAGHAGAGRKSSAAAFTQDALTRIGMVIPPSRATASAISDLYLRHHRSGDGSDIK